SGCIAGIIMSIIGVGLTPCCLRLMGTPDDVFGNAVAYLRIYFAGGIGIVMYNACLGIFQAIGDSKRPLYYLIIAASINVVLDILFVAVLGFGIEGAAIATVISQFVSAILAFIKLTRINESYKIWIRRIKINFNMLKKLMKMGIP